MLLCLWHRPAAATSIGPQVWDLPYAKVRQKKEKKKKEIQGVTVTIGLSLGTYNNNCIQTIIGLTLLLQ